MNIFDYSDETIDTITIKHMGELLSIALPLAHIQEEDIPPVPDGATDSQKFLWRAIHLAKHKDAGQFERIQLNKFLVDLENHAAPNP